MRESQGFRLKNEESQDALGVHVRGVSSQGRELQFPVEPLFMSAAFFTAGSEEPKASKLLKPIADLIAEQAAIAFREQAGMTWVSAYTSGYEAIFTAQAVNAPGAGMRERPGTRPSSARNAR